MNSFGSNSMGKTDGTASYLSIQTRNETGDILRVIQIVGGTCSK